MLGVFLICTIGISWAPICVAVMPASALSDTMTTSSSWLLSCMRTLIRVSLLNSSLYCRVVYPKYEKLSSVSPAGKVMLRIGSSALLLTTLKDVSANQRLGGRSVCHISADSELAAYRFLFFLLQKDVPSGYLVFYGFIGKGQIKYLRYCFLFDIECEAVVNLHLFSINERETGGVFYSF